MRNTQFWYSLRKRILGAGRLHQGRASGMPVQPMIPEHLVAYFRVSDLSKEGIFSMNLPSSSTSRRPSRLLDLIHDRARTGGTGRLGFGVREAAPKRHLALIADFA